MRKQRPKEEDKDYRLAPKQPTNPPMPKCKPPKKDILYLCNIYKNMTEGGCDGTMCMIGKLFNGECKYTRNRQFSKNYTDHEPTDEELFERFEDVGYAWVENEPIYADQYYIVRWNYEL